MVFFFTIKDPIEEIRSPLDSKIADRRIIRFSSFHNFEESPSCKCKRAASFKDCPLIFCVFLLPQGLVPAGCYRYEFVLACDVLAYHVTMSCLDDAFCSTTFFYNGLGGYEIGGCQS